jgi:hypothetical protein
MEKLDSGGCTCGASPCKDCTSTPKNIPFCLRCKFEFGVFHMTGHPDDGIVYACSLMTHSIREGGYPLSCTYFQPKIAPVIDAEAQQKQQFYYVGKMDIRPETWEV